MKRSRGCNAAGRATHQTLSPGMVRLASLGGTFLAIALAVTKRQGARPITPLCIARTPWREVQSRSDLPSPLVAPDVYRRAKRGDLRSLEGDTLWIAVPLIHSRST